jgi:hypothetical protein
MFIQGVGQGQQKCEWTVSIPIACRLSVDGRRCCLNYFEAPVVGGSGSHLPALLGLRSMSALSATLCMSEGREALFLPVDSQQSEDLANCRRSPLSKAPSGHLIMTIDHWNDLQADAAKGIVPDPMVLHTHFNPVGPTSCAIDEPNPAEPA